MLLSRTLLSVFALGSFTVLAAPLNTSGLAARQDTDVAAPDSSDGLNAALDTLEREINEAMQQLGSYLVHPSQCFASFNLRILHAHR